MRVVHWSCPTFSYSLPPKGGPNRLPISGKIPGGCVPCGSLRALPLPALVGFPGAVGFPVAVLSVGLHTSSILLGFLLCPAWGSWGLLPLFSSSLSSSLSSSSFPSPSPLFYPHAFSLFGLALSLSILRVCFACGSLCVLLSSPVLGLLSSISTRFDCVFRFSLLCLSFCFFSGVHGVKFYYCLLNAVVVGGRGSVFFFGWVFSLLICEGLDFGLFFFVFFCFGFFFLFFFTVVNRRLFYLIRLSRSTWVTRMFSFESPYSIHSRIHI